MYFLDQIDKCFVGNPMLEAVTFLVQKISFNPTTNTKVLVQVLIFGKIKKTMRSLF
jgi:hypothetical protein